MKKILLAVSLLLWSVAALLSASPFNMSWMNSGILALGGLAFVAAGSRKQAMLSPASEAFPGHDTWALAIGFGFALVLPFVWIYVRAVYPDLGTHLFFMPRSLAGYEGIPSAPFSEKNVLVAPALYWVACLGTIFFLRKSSPGRIALALFVLGMGGKLAIAFISGSGLEVLPQQITAVSTAFYRLGMIPHHIGVDTFITHFNDIQARLSTHGETHPFGPELYYLGLVKLVGASPWHVALAVSAVAGLVLPLIYALGRELFKDDSAALAACALFASAPPNLILATSGIDSTITMLFVAGLWLLLRGIRLRDLRLMAAAGCLGWILSLFTLAASYYFLIAAYLLFSNAMALDWPERRALIWQGLIFIGIFLGLHAVLWLGTSGQFNYSKVFQVARPVQEDLTRTRPYFLWVWLNGFLFFGYAGIANVGLAGLNAFKRRDGFWVSSLALFILIFIQSLGNGEVQRILHFLYVFVALWAAFSFSGSRDTAWWKRLALFCTLNFLSAVLLEALVMDYW